MDKRSKLVLKFLSPGFGGTELPDYIKQALDNGLAGITLFGSNTGDFDLTKKLIASIRQHNPQCIISIDEESGDVTRIWAESGSPFPTPYLMGRVDDASLTEEVFSSLGSYLAELDIDVTFGPVLDLVVESKNPIVGIRSFGSDSALAARHGVAAIKGLARFGVNACPKHFPGHGNTLADSHHSTPEIASVYNHLEKNDLAPFNEVIKAGVNAIMVGHLVLAEVDDEPASLSKIWIKEILQGKFGFTGAVVTDALDMGALGGLPKIGASAIRAIDAGAHLLCLSGISDQRQILSDIKANVLEFDQDKLELAAKEADKKIELLRRKPIASVGTLTFDLRGVDSGIIFTGSLEVQRSSVALLTLEADPTIAAGKISWGLHSSLMDAGCQMGPFDLAKTQIIQFRDAWRDSTVRGRLEMLLRDYPNAIFVDFGWPTEDFRPKNIIRTFGATSAHSQAALGALNLV